MRTSIAVLIASFVILLEGCTGYGKYLVTSENFAPTNKQDVKVYTTTVPQGEYKVLGYVSVYMSDGQDAGKELREKLKEHAAKLGADAIISFKLYQQTGSGGGAAGVAIRLK